MIFSINMESPEKIVLVDKEGVEHTVDGSILDLSEYLKSMKENGGIQNNRVVLDMIQGSTLTKIIEFCIILISRVHFIGTYHLDKPIAEIERPLKSSNMRDVVSEWDANFINMETEALMDLIVSANFLIIQSLLEVAYEFIQLLISSCAKVASMIKGKSPEEIRSTFNIVNDFTPEEEAKVDSSFSLLSNRFVKKISGLLKNNVVFIVLFIPCCVILVFFITPF